MKLFIFILLTFSALNPVLVYSSCEEAFSRLTSGQKKAQKFVWMVRSLGSSGAVSESALGTGFFIGPSTFVAPFFAVSKVLALNGIDGIILTQEGNLHKIKIKRIMHLSVLDNLAVFEIEGEVSGSLNQGIPPNPKENLSIIGYPTRNVKVIKTTGDIFRKNGFDHIFPGNSSNSLVASGSPVLNTDGEVVGVHHVQKKNVLHAVKIIHLQNLLKQKVELFESPKDHLEHSIKEAIETAEQGDVIAQLHLGYLYENGYGVEQDYKKAIYWFEKSAEQGDRVAQYYLATLYHLGHGVKQNHEEALRWYEKAAKQGHAPAQYNLGLSYYLGDGVERDYKKALKWWKKAAKQGYTLAQNNLPILHKALNTK